MIRPYYVPVPEEQDPLNQKNAWSEDGKIRANNYESLKKKLSYFSIQENIPRSFAKKIRNTYSLGKNQIGLLTGFLDSRNWRMPDGKKCTGNMYLGEDSDTPCTMTAKWYDALEIVDYNLLETKTEEGDLVDEEEKN